MSWINHLPPACWSTFWKSNFKQQLGCRFDIIDNEFYFFVFWHMQLNMSLYIRSFFGFTFWNILYFFKYSCTNIFHRRSLYTSYHIDAFDQLVSCMVILLHNFEYLPFYSISWLNASCFDLLWMSGHISGMDGPVDMEQRGYELSRYQTHYTTLTLDPTHDLDLGILSSMTFDTVCLLIINLVLNTKVL